MDFQTAVKVGLTEKYMTFEGRSSRSEYWWLFLAFVAGAIVFGLIGIWILQFLYSLVLLVPGSAAGYRRLQDTGRPGWYIFIPMGLGFLGNFLPQVEMDANGMPVEIPSFGQMAFTGIYSITMLVIALIFLWWLTRPSDPQTNEFGPPPAPS